MMGHVTAAGRDPRRAAARRRRLVAVGAIALVAVVALGGWWAYGKRSPEPTIGSATEEFVPPTTPVTTGAAPSGPVNWPTYGYDDARTRWNPELTLRPPYREVWSLRTRNLLEFPPIVADGRLFTTQLLGRVFAVDAASGRWLWRKNLRHCSPSSPAYADGIVYVAFLGPVPCPKDGDRTQGGAVYAWDAATGETVWHVDIAPTESSPLVVDGVVYVGAWDGRVYALDAKTGAVRWTTDIGSQITSSASWADAAATGGAPAVVIGTNDGSVYSLDAATGAVRWKAQSVERLGSGREYFYATPTIAYGRVYIGNTDGWMYAYGARTGKLIWAQAAGSYVYTAAVAAEGVIYIGTYDGYVIAYDAATGRENWRVEVPGAVHGAPTLMDGLLYFATCSWCGERGVRPSKRGPSHTYALDIATRRIVWTFRDGKYSPLVSDGERVYLAGTGIVYALEPVG